MAALFTSSGRNPRKRRSFQDFPEVGLAASSPTGGYSE